MTRTIAVLSGKGGVGKTTVTANLGLALALKGYKVCLIDADFGLRNLDVPLGLTNRIILDINDFLEGSCSLHHVLIRHREAKNLHFIPGSKSKNSSEIDEHILAERIKEMRSYYDFILIDSPAGIEKGFIHAINACDEAIVVTTPDKTALQDADRVIGILESYPEKKVQLLVNLVETTKHCLEEILNLLNIDLLGVLPADSQIIYSVHKGIPVVLDPSQKSGLLYRRIASKLCGHEIPFHDEIENKKPKHSILNRSFFQRKLNRMRLSH
ncbi:septum site-determining protein MinD [Niallia nealsonii]|uniref:Septum site-determining protein MinD n=1 Tax=Niallia nealsonii TaxID=115979 RepID=A0A2N0Z115_9BACI|nr:septum site-determining protein MinD [Niallia nealsonii]PKG23201.1 septum site-determining protein MinD [Niallia nealsonii]